MEYHKPSYQDLLDRISELETRLKYKDEQHSTIPEEILDVISEPTSLVNKNYEYVFVNKAYSNYFQKKPENIIGRKVIELVGSENFNKVVKPYIDRCLQGETIVYENIISTGENNSDTYLLMNYYPHYNNDNAIDGIISTAKDVTRETVVRKNWLKTINAIDDVLLIVNNNFVIEDINSNGLNLLQKSREEVIGKPCYKIFHGLNKPDPDCALCKCRQTRKTETVVRYEKAFKKWFSIKSSPIFNSKNQIIKYVDVMRDISSLKDKERIIKETNEEYLSANEELRELNEEYASTITELKRTNKEYASLNEEYIAIIEQLRIAKQLAEENERRFRNLYEYTSIGVAIVSLNFEIQKANKAYCKMLGYRENELIGKTLKEITHPETIEYNIELQKKLGKGIIPYFQLEKKFIHKYGHTVYGLLNATLIKNTKGEPLYFIGNVQDITEMKIAENEIKENEELFRATFEQAAIGIAHVAADGSFIRLNQKFCKIVGYHEEELKKLTYMDITHPDDLRMDNHYVNQVIDGKIDSFTIEKRYLHKNGAVIWINLYSSVVRDDKGRIKYAVAMISDITMQKAIEKELIKAKDKAEESDRLKSAFLANMSHEIRTPMNGIIGFSDMLNQPDLSNTKRQYYIEIIQNSSQQLLNVVNDVLDISKIETGQMEIRINETRVNEVIDEAFVFFKAQAKINNLNIYPNKTLPDDQSTVYTDKSKLKQILNNLINNALKFTTEGHIEFGYHLKNQNLEFYVEDTGIGIKPELHDKIFERFRQGETGLTKNFRGTGLGLAICKSFTGLLGGRIWLTSVLSKGTTFYFTIPYKPVYEIPVSSENQADNKQELTFTILVAEDEEINYLYIEEILENQEITLLHAKNGIEAIELFKENDVDLVLMDIKMPVMDGYQATKIIKKLNPGVPVIAQTAYALSTDREKALQKGCDDYIPKPLKKSDLLQMVNKFQK